MHAGWMGTVQRVVRQKRRLLGWWQPPRREWLVIENVRSYGVFVGAGVPRIAGYFPRDIAEQLLGRDLDGPCWFTRTESDRLRAHPAWRNTEPPGVVARPMA